MAEREVTVTMTIDAPPDQVWRAMTDPGLVEQWMMGAQVDSTWQKGDPITWSLDRAGNDKTELSLAQDGAQSDDEAEQFTSNWTAMLGELRTVAER